ncbi:MAG TPA: hypothetical protein VID19_13090 [Candidatus Eremiobacteraceae bacterium]
MIASASLAQATKIAPSRVAAPASGGRPHLVAPPLDGGGTALGYDAHMERREHRFVVHVWFESAGNAEGQWRGEIDHVGHGRRLYFSSLGDLIDFIKLRLGDPAISGVSDRPET